MIKICTYNKEFKIVNKEILLENLKLEIYSELEEKSLLKHKKKIDQLEFFCKIFIRNEIKTIEIPHNLILTFDIKNKISSINVEIIDDKKDINKGYKCKITNFESFEFENLKIEKLLKKKKRKKRKKKKEKKTSYQKKAKRKNLKDSSNIEEEAKKKRIIDKEKEIKSKREEFQNKNRNESDFRTFDALKKSEDYKKFEIIKNNIKDFKNPVFFLGEVLAITIDQIFQLEPEKIDKLDEKQLLDEIRLFYRHIF